MHPRRAFSLVELLVVIAVMFVLVTIVSRALVASTVQARDLQCRARLHQLFAAQISYATDHRTFTAAWSQSDPTTWKARLRSYAAGRHEDEAGGLYHCPAVRRNELEDAAAIPGNGDSIATMALNGAMLFAQWQSRPTSVVNPAKIILIGEQPVEPFEHMLTADRYGVWSNDRYTNWYRADDHDPKLGFRHGTDRANIAFADGHVGALSEAQLMRESGHWYWWDALAGDTASAPPGGGQPNYQMPSTPSPTPTPTPSDPGDPPPVGPLRLPCGCPLPGSS